MLELQVPGFGKLAAMLHIGIFCMWPVVAMRCWNYKFLVSPMLDIMIFRISSETIVNSDLKTTNEGPST